MQAGGDVLGGCLTAKYVALEHLGQLISSYVGKVPVGEGHLSVYQCLPVLSLIRTPPIPSLSIALLQGFCPQMVSCGCCLLARGQTGMHGEVRGNG